MANDIFKWIRNVSALNDEQLKQEIDLVHQSCIKAFAREQSQTSRRYSHSWQWNTYRAQLCWYNQYMAYSFILDTESALRIAQYFEVISE
jgi:hypothetical protein